MRNKYRISRGGDGRLIVKPFGGRGTNRRRIGLLVISVALLLMAGNLIPVSGALSAVIEMSESWFKDNSESAPEKIVVKLNLSSQTIISDPMLSPQEHEAVPRVVEPKLVFPITNKPLETPPTPSSIVSVEEIEVIDAVKSEQTTKAAQIPERTIHEVTVRSGDSLYTIFNALGIAQRELIEITKGEGKQLRRIHPGQVLVFHLGENNELQKLVYKIDEMHSNHFVKVESRYETESVEVALESRRTFAQGQIDSSLFLAGQAAGLPDKTIMELAEIFGWDIDFA